MGGAKARRMLARPPVAMTGEGNFTHKEVRVVPWDLLGLGHSGLHRSGFLYTCYLKVAGLAGAGWKVCK